MSTTVAIIDDDSQKRRRIRSALEREALTVVEHDPENMKRSDLDDHGHGIFVVDIVMPVFDGIEVIRHLRRNGHPATIIAYSSEYPEYVPYASKLGADESISICSINGVQRLAESVRSHFLLKRA